MISNGSWQATSEARGDRAWATTITIVIWRGIYIPDTISYLDLTDRLHDSPEILQGQGTLRIVRCGLINAPTLVCGIPRHVARAH